MIELRLEDYQIEPLPFQSWDAWDMHEENLKFWLAPIKTCNGRERVTELGAPKDIQRKNLLKILEWLYRWGYSSADILSDLLGRANRSHARRLEKDGWLVSVSIKGYPTYYVLSQRGLHEAIHHSKNLYEYKELDQYRVHLPNLHHGLHAQTETLVALKNGSFYSYLTERMFSSIFEKDEIPHKTPDSILIKRCESDFQEFTHQFVGVEIELTPKWGPKLDMFVSDIVDDIQTGRLNMFLIISDSKAILERYTDAFTPGSKVKRWQQSKVGKFTDTGEILEIPKWASKHIVFREVGSLDPYPASDFL